MIKVKICGINAPAAFDACVEAAVDWIGFVFYPPSPRSVLPAQAATLSARYAGGPKRVGLFVEPTEAQIAGTLAAVHLDALQLYADAARVAELRARFGVPVWRAIGVRSPADLPLTADGGDRLVMEAPAVPGGSRPGGNARQFDWSMLAGWPAPLPWLLAGGLSASNVQDAIRVTGATAVDVSSGVETALGQKDPSLIAAFVDLARQPAVSAAQTG
jgi:phosphoribosylanthranilate isomerase